MTTAVEHHRPKATTVVAFPNATHLLEVFVMYVVASAEVLLRVADNTRHTSKRKRNTKQDAGLDEPRRNTTIFYVIASQVRTLSNRYARQIRSDSQTKTPATKEDEASAKQDNTQTTLGNRFRTAQTGGAPGEK